MSWVLCGVAVFSAIGFQALTRDGILRNPVAVQRVRESHIPTFLPRLSTAEMTERAAWRDAVIIDARFPRDYQMGHIPNSINIPITASALERRELLSYVPSKSEIIVYCQSTGCAFDEEVASSLVADGYENVSLYPDGWVAWHSELCVFLRAEWSRRWSGRFTGGSVSANRTCALPPCEGLCRRSLCTERLPL
jgi:rhodanese-related sulfurtransferase